MKFFDKSLKLFSEEAQAKGIQADDLGQLFYKIEIYQNSREPYWSSATYKQHLQSDDRIFYTENEQEMNAFIFYRWVEADLEVTHWAVKHKGCGEGGIVFGLFLSQIASRAYKIILECGEWNQSALKLYEAFQFNKSGFRPQYYRTGEGAWILERSHNS